MQHKSTGCSATLSGWHVYNKRFTHAYWRGYYACNCGRRPSGIEISWISAGEAEINRMKREAAGFRKALQAMRGAIRKGEARAGVRFTTVNVASASERALVA